MNILEIYKKYQIMPQLQEHQLRVAGVAELLISNISNLSSLILGREDVVKACLLHDMGNIVKFDLHETQNLINSNIDLEHWQKVQSEYRQKYGDNEYQAHIAIAKKIGVSVRVMELIESINFLGAPVNAASRDFGKKICQYADDRVGPWGVVSLEERFSDLRKRYAHHGEDTKEKREFEKALRQIEKQIFAHCKIEPEEITNERVKEKIEILKNYDI